MVAVQIRRGPSSLRAARRTHQAPRRRPGAGQLTIVTPEMAVPEMAVPEMAPPPRAAPAVGRPGRGGPGTRGPVQAPVQRLSGCARRVTRQRVHSDVVYRRRRRLALTGLAMVVAGLWFALQAAVGGAGGGPLTATGAAAGVSPAAAHVWVVQPGDTLWSIALRAGARGDIRPVVDRLAAETGGRPLAVGQRIVLP